MFRLAMMEKFARTGKRIIPKKPNNMRELAGGGYNMIKTIYKP